MRTALFLIVITAPILLLFSSFSSEVPLDIDNQDAASFPRLVKEKQISIQGLCEKLKSLPDFEKQKLRLIFHAQLRIEQERGYVAPGTYTTYLVALDDHDAIKKAIELFHRRGDSEDLVLSCNPKIIKLIGDDLLRSTKPLRSIDVIIDSPSSQAWVVIRSIIATASEFSPELKSWVARGPRFLSSEEFGLQAMRQTDIIRKWWRSNRNAFLLDEFHRIKPGDQHIEFDEEPAETETSKSHESGSILPEPSADTKAVSSNVDRSIAWVIGLACSAAAGFLLLRYCAKLRR